MKYWNQKTLPILLSLILPKEKKMQINKKIFKCFKYLKHKYKLDLSDIDEFFWYKDNEANCSQLNIQIGYPDNSDSAFVMNERYDNIYIDIDSLNPLKQRYR